MTLATKLSKASRILSQIARSPRATMHYLWEAAEGVRGRRYPQLYAQGSNYLPVATTYGDGNPLEVFFDSHEDGRGIWKWRHHFDIYHTHFAKFVNREVHIVEVGVFSGGSLEMWRSYFGSRSHVYGIDTDEVCKAYKDERTDIFIGDQEDRNFWRDFKARIPQIDIRVDDGGHLFNQQIVTHEEMLPHIKPGGVCVCEDVYGTENGFSSFCQGLTTTPYSLPLAQPHEEPSIQANALQKWIRGIYFYPYVIVIEKATEPVERLTAERHGTMWQKTAMEHIPAKRITDFTSS